MRQFSVELCRKNLGPFVGHREAHGQNARYAVGRNLFGYPALAACYRCFAGAQDQEFDAGVLSQCFAQGFAGDLFFVAVFVLKVQNALGLIGQVGAVSADVHNIVLPGVQGFAELIERGVFQKLDHYFGALITRSFQCADRPDQPGLFFFYLQHFAPLTQVFGQGGDEQHFQGSGKGMVALHVEIRQRRRFGAHQPEVIDGHTFFGFSQFGRKQQRQDHFKRQVDDFFVVGRNG